MDTIKDKKLPDKDKKLYTLMGLANPGGGHYKERLAKQQQMEAYYTVIKSVVKRLSTRRTLYLYDCGCGRGYISFYSNLCLKEESRDNLFYVGIDSNAALIERSKTVAGELGLGNMTFFTSSIADFSFPYRPDIVYSLHACDAATDQTLHKGIIEQARYILSVSCCQHTAQGQIKCPSMPSVSRHKPYKERLTDMVADSLRVLLLEALGYRVTVFEFVAQAATPKNIMLRCERGRLMPQKTERAMEQYILLSERFNVRPGLEYYLQGRLVELSAAYREYLKAKKTATEGDAR